MQVFGLQRAVYRGAGLASRLGAETSHIAAARRDALRRSEQARRDGLTAEHAAKAVGVSRASLNRWSHRLEPKSRRPRRTRPKTWTSPLIRAVERLRDDYPMWGRAKLGPLVRAQGFETSDSTVGRILTSLVARGRVQPVARLRKSPKPRHSYRRRHAIRLPKGLRPARPGAVVQIDTVFVTLAPGRPIKHFTAYCPVAKWTVAKAVGRATARAASLFLDKMLEEMPFPVQAIQVDGGSEFKAEFRDRLQGQGPRPLRTAAQAAPTQRRGSSAATAPGATSFYGVYDLPRSLNQLNPLLDSFQHLYNYHRPHGALDGLTPAAHLAKLQADETPPSHMC